MFFKKKKKEVLLNHGLLAEALMSLTVKNWYDFERKTEHPKLLWSDVLFSLNKD